MDLRVTSQQVGSLKNQQLTHSQKVPFFLTPRLGELSNKNNSKRLTDWELQDLAVQVFRERIAKDGHQLMSWNGDPRVNPSVWFVGASGGPEWVLVRAVRYPEKEATEPENMTELKSHFDKMGFSGHFASVAIASADDPFDPDAERNGNFVPLYRGCGMHIRYEGLRPL